MTKLDTALLTADLDKMADYTKAVEAIGFNGIWISETNRDPFLALALAAEHSENLELATGIAVAFPRSPTILAQLAWDLARFSKGQFILGLGSQVKAHNELRFGVKWEKPVRKMRETIEAIRAVWDSWQHGTPLNYEGEFFKLKLMTPFFSGGPLKYPYPPIYISAVNELMLKLAGKACDGVMLHAFHSPKYFKEFAMPHLEAGLKQTNRKRKDFCISAGIFVVPTDNAKEASHTEAYVRQQLSFYMSTPAYRVVLELHNWQATSFKLNKLAKRGDWAEMPKLISDEMLDTFAISGRWSELPSKIKQRYNNQLNRVTYYLPFTPGQNDEGWQATLANFNG